MEKKRATIQPQGLVGKFKEAWSHNSMVSTLFALLVMILIQAVVVLCQDIGVLLFEFFLGHAGIGGHFHHPLFQIP